jgi:hypothetical protein
MHLEQAKRTVAETPRRIDAIRLHRKFREYTMVGRESYVSNIMAASRYSDVHGCVVECGVWRGGMIAGLAEFLGNDRTYYLFDSFEGLPPAQAIDGLGALAWQADVDSPRYFDNCRAEQTWAKNAMRLSGATRFECVKGWFDDTLPPFVPETPIALLRIDADWYESVLCCLRNLAPHLAEGGLIVLDDYGTWEGCSKAVHRYLADIESPARIDRIERTFVIRS